MKTKMDAIEAIKKLHAFIGMAQLKCMGDAMRGEEKQFFFDLACEWAEKIEKMPKTYEQDGAGDAAIIHLHYFKNGMDWWITEKDMEPEQLQAFGYVNLGDPQNAELGYISIEELKQNGIEFDLYWKPKPLGEIKAVLEFEAAA